jgi:2-phospho-L-lactate transferase/gluconeogenesis factor (CofD/UPF0052 family)
MDCGIKIVIFSGGRGTAAISRFLLDRVRDIRLTVCVNAYDDGLSTGALRSFIPGMLGPSDIRKNLSALAPSGSACLESLKWLFEYRFPLKAEDDEILAGLSAIARLAPHECLFPVMSDHLQQLSYMQLKSLADDVAAFLAYHDLRKDSAGFQRLLPDCSFGNIIFAGRYLLMNHDFNATCLRLGKFIGCQAEVINVSDGANLVLAALEENGAYLERESDIVKERGNAAAISELFLLERYLDDAEKAELDGISSLREKIAFLRAREAFPGLNPMLEERLASADMIIYGPGTQHSSLLPSYLTKGLTEAIEKNMSAVKVFVMNVAKDYDIERESVGTLLSKFSFYCSRKETLPVGRVDGNLITHAFIQQEMEDNSFHLSYFQNRKRIENTSRLAELLGLSEVYTRDWQGEPGRHYSDLIVRELLGLLENTPSLQARRSGTLLLSVVVLALNEESRIEGTLRDLRAVDLSGLGIRKELIVVDGGSTDGTVAIAENVDGVKIVRLASGLGGGGIW